MLTPPAWDLAYYLDITFPVFKDLTQHIAKNLQFYKDYVKSTDPLTYQLDPKYAIFEKILLLKIFRSEKILFAISDYVHS